MHMIGHDFHCVDNQAELIGLFCQQRLCAGIWDSRSGGSRCCTQPCCSLSIAHLPYQKYSRLLCFWQIYIVLMRIAAIHPTSKLDGLSRRLDRNTPERFGVLATFPVHWLWLFSGLQNVL